MVFPFTQVFAHAAKGANELILGAMVTGSALTSIILAIPWGGWPTGSAARGSCI